MVKELKSADEELKSNFFQEERDYVITALSEGFGAPSAVRALEGFSRLARAAVSHHPNSKAARSAGRLAYLAAAITSERVVLGIFRKFKFSAFLQFQNQRLMSL